MAVRFLSDQEAADVPLIGSAVSDEQGVTAGERFVVKNLAANPEAAKRYLQKLGYQVRSYGSGFNFAVRKSGNEPWKVVDPRGMDKQDLFDLVTDFLTGAASTAGFAAGPLGAAVTGGGAELLRQAAGQAAGVPENLDLTQAGLTAAVSGAIPLAGKYIAKPIGKALGKAGLEVAGRAMGIRGTEALGRREIVREALGPMARNLPTRMQAARTFRDGIEKLQADNIVAAKGADALLDGVPGTVNIRPVLDRIREFTRVQAGTKTGESVAKETSLAGNASQVLDDIRAYLGTTRTDQVPVKMAAGVKRILQRRAKYDKVTPTGAEFQGVMRDAAFGTRQRVEEAVNAAGRADYVPIMRKVDESLDILDNFQHAIKDDKAANSYIRHVYGESGDAALEAIQDAERHFGVNLEETIRKANIRSIQRAAEMRGSQQAGLTSRMFIEPTARHLTRTALGGNTLGSALRVGANVAALPSQVGSVTAIQQGIRSNTPAREDPPKKSPKLVLGSY